MTVGTETTDYQLGHDIQAVAAGANQFAFDLYRALANELPWGDLFLSPTSIYSALAMLLAGARGSTAEELRNALHILIPHERFERAFRKLLGADSATGDGFRTANRIWGQAGYAFEPEYLSSVRETFDSGLGEVDFRDGREAACEAINAWVSDQTRGRIPRLVAPTMFDGDTRMVVTNAVYFLDAWSTPFKPEKTRDQEFWISSEHSRKLPMMRRTGLEKYFIDDTVQVVALDYENSFQMCFALPCERHGLQKLETTLEWEQVHKWLVSTLREVILDIPRFSLESRMSLKQSLEQLDIHNAISLTKADFSGIADDPRGLAISNVIHQATLRVDEEGSEAAAATVTSTIGASGQKVPKPPVEFRADHPFLVLIRDRRSRLIHFVGRMTGMS